MSDSARLTPGQLDGPLTGAQVRQIQTREEVVMRIRYFHRLGSMGLPYYEMYRWLEILEQEERDDDVP